MKHDEPLFVGHQFHAPYAPGQPGREATGESAAVGAGVSSVGIGDRVSTWRDPGHHKPGCYAQYVLLDAADVVRVPRALPAAATAPVELAACVASVVLRLKSMDALAGRQVGVSGLGPAGLIAVQMAKAEGAARIVGFELAEQRRTLGRQLGVDLALDPRSLAEQLAARPHRPQLDTTIDCVGAKASVEFAMDHTRDVVALFGVQREPYTFAPRHWFSEGGGLRLCGYPGPSRQAAEYAVRLIEHGLLDLAPLSTHHLPLERYMEGIGLLERQEAIKVCFLPWDS